MTEDPKRDLLQVVAQALEFCATTVRMADDESPDLDGGPGVRPLVLSKVVGEASLLARCAHPLASQDLEVRRSVGTLVGLLEPRARPDTLLAALCLDPGRALDHAYAHLQLSRMGSIRPDIDRLLELAHANSQQYAGPRTLLDEVEAAWLSGSDITPDLVRRSAVGQPVAVLRFEPGATYEFTHAAMQISDLGHQQVELPRSTNDLSDDADAMLAAALDQDNLDLVAEVLWTWPMLRLEWSRTARFAFDLLLDTWASLDFLPGPGFDRAHAASLDADPAAAYARRTSYHTTLVMGMLCASILMSNVTPAPLHLVAPGPIETDLLDGVLSRRWHQHFARLDALDRAELGGLVVTVALQRAQAASDIQAVRTALQYAVERELTSGPAVRQGVELLARARVMNDVCLSATA